MDLSVFFLVVCVPTIFCVYLVDRRRKRNAQELSEHLAVLTARIYKLEEQTKQTVSAVAAHPAVTQAPPARAPVPTPVAERPSPVFLTPAPPTPTPPPLIASPQKPSVTIPPAAQPVHSQPVPPPPPPPVTSAPRPSAGVSAAAGSTLGSKLPTAPPPRPAPSPSLAPPQPRVAAAAGVSRTIQPAVKKPRRSLEEVVGVRLFPIIGIAAVVVGVGFLLGTGWGSFPAWLRVLILYTAGLGLLGGGIFLERKDRYRILGRGLIGGGWAVIAATTYAIANLPHELVLPSKTVDLFLLLAVVAAMVRHTLKYDSQKWPQPPLKALRVRPEPVQKGSGETVMLCLAYGWRSRLSFVFGP